jgi:hypothetical protein
MRPDMDSNQPPRFATWLLERTTSDEKRESLIGDLLEQFVHGRSAAWYWRQAIGSILAGSARDIRDHKLLAVRAVSVGLASMWVFSAVVRFALQVLWVLASGGVYIGGHWIRLDYGWIRYRMYIAFLLTLFGSAASGWIVGRMHRDRQAPMVLAYLTSALVAAIVQMAVQIRLIGWTIRPVAQYPQTIVLFFVLVPIAILVGGVMSLRPLEVSFQWHPSGAATTADRETRDEDS